MDHYHMELQLNQNNNNFLFYNLYHNAPLSVKSPQNGLKLTVNYLQTTLRCKMKLVTC